MKPFATTFLPVLTGLVLCGCTPGKSGSPAPAAAPAAAAEFSPAPLQEHQGRLLDQAFTAVSKMPLDPHIKNRSRAQHKVVTACLQLRQPQLAEKYLRQIDNWERCFALVDVACFYAENNCPDLAEQVLKPALEMIRIADDIRAGKVVAASPDPVIDSLQDWRLDRVKARLYQTQIALGKTVSLDEVAAQMQPDKTAPVMVDEMVRRSGMSFEQSMAGLAQIAMSQNFEVVQQALHGYAELMDRHYQENDLRGQIETQIVTNMDQRLPNLIKIDVLTRLAEVALAHADHEQALKYIDRAETCAAGKSPLNIPPKTRLIVLRAKAGDAQKAQTGLDALTQSFADQRDSMANIERAALLCRLAETYECLGQRETALKLYSRAVDEGLDNPNARPRADDFNEICCSMALHGVEPNEALGSKLQKMNSVLGNPW